MSKKYFVKLVPGSTSVVTQDHLLEYKIKRVYDLKCYLNSKDMFSFETHKLMVRNGFENKPEPINDAFKLANISRDSSFEVHEKTDQELYYYHSVQSDEFTKLRNSKKTIKLKFVNGHFC